MSINVQMAVYFVAGPVFTVAAIVAMIFVVMAITPAANATDKISCEVHNTMSVTCHSASIRHF
jgi:uncharacterized membrane protein YozB (DUF420 family)